MYSAYLHLGSPAGRPDQPSLLPDDVLIKLRKSCAGSPELKKVIVANDQPLVLDLPLNKNDVYFINVKRSGSMP